MVWGDNLMGYMRYIIPSFCICNGVIWGGASALLKQFRDREISDHESGKTGWSRIPDKIDDLNPWMMNNIGGDIVALLVGSVLWWVVFIFLDNVPWSKIEAELEGTWLERLLVRKFQKPRSDEEL